MAVLARLARLRPLLAVLVLVSVLAALVAALKWTNPLAPVLMAVATTLALIALAGTLALLLERRSRRSLAETLISSATRDPDAIVLTDGNGRTLAANPAAIAILPAASCAPAIDHAAIALTDLLARWSAEPARAVAALLADAVALGQARRDFARPDGGLRLAVHHTGGARSDGGDSGRGGGDSAALLVWRFSASAQVEARNTDILGLPLLTLGPDHRPLAVNTAFRTQFGDPGTGLAVAEGNDAEIVLGLDLEAALAPLRQGVNPTLVVQPGAQSRLAFATTARDGQRDILFLPGWLSTLGGRASPAPRHDFEDIPVALMLLDAEGRIIDTNRPARGLMGLAPGESRFFWEVVEGLGRPVADWLEDARDGRALNRPEVLRATLPPQETFVQIILRRAAGPDNENALVAVINDATELKSLEARFVQSQKMQAIGQLAGGVAHDFNNLLTAISGHCDLLLLNRDHYDPDYNDLVQIHQNTNRAAALVRQLLAFSRKQTLKPETLSLESLLEDLAHLLTRLVGERITLTLSHDPRIGTIRADRRQLEQVIMNLVVNARDAMPMGGEILIETEALRLASELERGRARLPPGDYAVISVSDEGLGIPADIIDKIFEPFFTTKRTGEGTGLGLSTAYGIVKQMGGWIFATSTEGTGTRFALYFATHLENSVDPAEPADPQHRRLGGVPATPVSGASTPPATEIVPQAPRAGSAPESRAGGIVGRGAAGVATPSSAPAAKPAPPAVPETAREGGVVLLVEDEAPVRAFAARALRLQGYQVVEAENGEQALEFLEDPALRVTIFVTDVIMPGIDGPGWVSRALVNRPGTPVVFVSGYTEDGLSAALSRIPRAVFLGKPFALQDLTETIARQLALRDQSIRLDQDGYSRPR